MFSENDFFQDCFNGNLDNVEFKLDVIDPNTRDFDGATGLHWAASASRSTIVRVLLERGADCNITNKEGTTPLHEAAGIGSLECVELLLNAGAKPNIKNSSGYTPLTRAAFYGHPEIVVLLLDHGADHSILNQIGISILAAAVMNVPTTNFQKNVELQSRGVNQWGCYDVIPKLLEAGADPNLKKQRAPSAIEVAEAFKIHSLIAALRGNLSKFDEYKNLKNQLIKFGVTDGISLHSGLERNKVSQFISNQLTEFLPATAKLVGLSTTELSSRLNIKSGLMEETINACAEPLDGGHTFSVQINLGMMQYLHHMSKLFVSRVAFETKDGRQNPQYPFEQTMQGFREIATAYYNGNIIQNRGISLRELNKYQMELYADMLHYMEGFVIAHELGHVVQWISQQPLQISRLIETFVYSLICKKQIPFPPELSSIQQEKKLVTNWKNELLADNIGMNIICQTAGERHEDGLAFTACEFFLILLRMLEEFNQHTHCQQISYFTHPPASVRLEVLRSLVNSSKVLPKKPGILPLGELFSEMADWIIAEL